MRRLALFVPALLLILAQVPAEAAAPPPYLVDAVGDANGVNEQKGFLPLNSTSTPPASVGWADIVSVSFATLYTGKGRARRPNGLQVTMKLAEAPADTVLYSVNADWRGTCDGLRSTLALWYLFDRELSQASASCESSDGSANDVLADAQVDVAARTITWRTRPTMARGSSIISATADTSVFVAPLYDDAAADGSWFYGR